MNIQELLTHLNSISSQIHTHWYFYAVVAFGIATGLSIKVEKIKKRVGLLLIVGLSMFLVTNFNRINEE